MKKVAIIPLRKGSKGIPGKNKKKMLGRPLFSWVLSAAIFSDLDEVYVFKDDEMSDDEYAMLDTLPDLLPNTRLACQLQLSPAMEGLKVRLHAMD